MSWGEDYNGGPSHRGICPNCGGDTYTCHDELCESCQQDVPVKCPLCLDMVHPSHMTEHGCCIICLDYKAEEFAGNIELVPLFNEIINEIKH